MAKSRMVVSAGGRGPVIASNAGDLAYPNPTHTALKGESSQRNPLVQRGVHALICITVWCTVW